MQTTLALPSFSLFLFFLWPSSSYFVDLPGGIALVAPFDLPLLLAMAVFIANIKPLSTTFFLNERQDVWYLANHLGPSLILHGTKPTHTHAGLLPSSEGVFKRQEHSGLSVFSKEKRFINFFLSFFIDAIHWNGVYVTYHLYQRHTHTNDKWCVVTTQALVILLCAIIHWKFPKKKEGEIQI